MSTTPYPYNQQKTTRYEFSSEGPQSTIVKIVEFVPLDVPGIENIGFGDIQPDGSISDLAESNNNDFSRVISTVLAIIKDYSLRKPEVKIIFKGSNGQRTRVYEAILRRYFKNFSGEFEITALILEDTHFKEVVFELDSEAKYFAFLVKRII